MVTRANPSVPDCPDCFSAYGQESQGFTVKIPLELGERFCLMSTNVTLSKTMDDRSFKKECDISLLATENRRRYIRVSDIVCEFCYGGTEHFNDLMIDNFFNNPSKNPLIRAIPALIFSPLEAAKQMARDKIKFASAKHGGRYGYIYDEAQFYALSELSYEKQFLISTQDKD
jgi:hypothetical protein